MLHNKPVLRVFDLVLIRLYRFHAEFIDFVVPVE